MSEKCLCEASQVVLLPCSGGSNCGQIANAAAVELTRQGVGNMYCLAGLGARISGMVESARSAQRLVVIDGCSVACALKTVKAVGLEPGDYLDVTQQGIEKNHDLNLAPGLVDAIVDKVRSLLATPSLHT
jgi:uncharacterized metal-binding protein